MERRFDKQIPATQQVKQVPGRCHCLLGAVGIADKAIMQRKRKSLPDSVLVFDKGALCKFTSVPTKSFRPNKHM